MLKFRYLPLVGFRRRFGRRLAVGRDGVALGRFNLVIDIQLGGLLKRLADRKITLTLPDAARDLLSEEGYDPVYGARPLKRVIQRRVLDPLALGVLQGQFPEGSTVLADAPRRTALATAARQSVEQHFSAGVMCSRFLAVATRLTSATTSSRS